MYDAVDLVLFAQYCVQNGVGMIARGRKEDEYVLKALVKKALLIRGRIRKLKSILRMGRGLRCRFPR